MSCCSSDSCCSPCAVCKAFKVIVAILLTVATLASIASVWVTHVRHGSLFFGSLDGSAALLVLVIASTKWLRLVRCLCPCGKCKGSCETSAK